jgi:hypothetical protein
MDRLTLARTAFLEATERCVSLQRRLDVEVLNLHTMMRERRYEGGHIRYTATLAFRLANAVLDAGMACDKAYLLYRDAQR